MLVRPRSPKTYIMTKPVSISRPFMRDPAYVLDSIQSRLSSILLQPTPVQRWKAETECLGYSSPIEIQNYVREKERERREQFSKNVTYIQLVKLNSKQAYS